MPTARVDLRATSPTIDTIEARLDAPARTVGFVDNFFPGWSGAYNLEGMCGADSLINPYYRELVDASGMERVWDWRYKLEDRDLKSVRPLLDAINVRFYLDYPAGQRLLRKELQPLASSDMEAYESTSVWPRAFFTDRVAVYEDLWQFISWIKSGDGSPFAAMQHSDWIHLSPQPRVQGDISGRQIRPAEEYKLTTNTTSFSVSATGPGFIVLTEAFESDNFRATLNGKAVPYIRLNHAFKGIYADSPGKYLVKFSYWPRGLSTTLLISGIGMGLALLEILVALVVLRPNPNERTAVI